MKNLKKLMQTTPKFSWILTKPTIDTIESMRIGQAIMESLNSKRKHK